MPTYEFRCDSGHGVDVILPMSAGDREMDCPECGSTSRRRISSPALGHGASTASRLIDATQATSHRPGVVDALPASGTRRRAQPVSRDPRHAALPKP